MTRTGWIKIDIATVTILSLAAGAAVALGGSWLSTSLGVVTGLWVSELVHNLIRYYKE